MSVERRVLSCPYRSHGRRLRPNSFLNSDLLTMSTSYDALRPPVWKRALVIALVAVLVGLGFYLRGGKPESKVIYASRCVTQDTHTTHAHPWTGTLKSSSIDPLRVPSSRNDSGMAEFDCGGHIPPRPTCVSVGRHPPPRSLTYSQ